MSESSKAKASSKSAEPSRKQRTPGLPPAAWAVLGVAITAICTCLSATLAATVPEVGQIIRQLLLQPPSSFQATQAAFEVTKTAFANLPTQTPAIQTLSVTQPPIVVTRIITQMVEATPVANDKGLSIENFPGETFSFNGNGGYGELHVIRKANDDFDYLFYYNMPPSGDGYAGIFFRFTPTINFTEFASLEAMISFSDENAICQIYLEDQVGGKSYITLGNNKLLNASEEARMEIEGNNRVFTIPIAGNF